MNVHFTVANSRTDGTRNELSDEVIVRGQDRAGGGQAELSEYAFNSCV